jgi:hypothetical protein
VVPPSSDRIPRVPPYSRTKELPYPYRAVTVCGAPFQALPVRAHWPLAWSAFARHYSRSLILMSFPPATEMVQFAGFASPTYGFSRRYPQRGGLPHSEIRGSTVARTSPRLFAACHVLHRLSVPRHPPDALTSRSPTPSPKRAKRRAWCRCASIAPPMLTHRRSHTHARIRPDGQAGPASRFHDSLHDVKRAENRGRRTDRTRPFTPSANSKRQASEAGDRLSRLS